MGRDFGRFMEVLLFENVAGNIGEVVNHEKVILSASDIDASGGMKLQTLEKISIDELLKVFNSAFSDYIVPLQLTKEQLTMKMVNDNIRLDLSVGAFANHRLIAFVLHGDDTVDNIAVAYNAGTGVIRTKRGQRLTGRLYEFALPILRSKRISKILLEVIVTNATAINAYTSIGYTIGRQLNVYKGTMQALVQRSPYTIGELKKYDWMTLQSLWEIKPSWQNSKTAVENMKGANKLIAVHDGNTLIGYLIYNTRQQRVVQFAVMKQYRRQGIGYQLFQYISNRYCEEITVVNVDEQSAATNYFLIAIGLKKIVQQHEMELSI